MTSTDHQIYIGQPISHTQTVLGLTNGMIGGTILILPLLGIKAGYITTIVVCLVMGFISYYTAYLIVAHLGKARTVRESVLAHFSHNYLYVKLYNFFIWFTFLPLFFIYFKLICLQLQGLFNFHSPILPIAVLLILSILIIVIRIFHFGQQALAYGVISIIMYLLFLIWAQFTAPDGPNKIEPYGQPITLGSTLIMAYSIHDFVVQNIIKHPTRQNYPKIVAQTFLIGTIAYTFITYGSFALINRIPIRQNPQTVSDYFYPGQWQMSIIQILYLIHLFSVFPNFLIVSKTRFFQMFNKDFGKDIQILQIVYILGVVGVSYLIYSSGMRIQSLIQINGSIMGFIYVVVIPLWMHFKCVFYQKSSGYIEGDDERNSEIKQNECQCEVRYSSKWSFYLQTIFLVFVIISGGFFAIVGFSRIFKEKH